MLWIAHVGLLTMFTRRKTRGGRGVSLALGVSQELPERNSYHVAGGAVEDAPNERLAQGGIHD